MRRSKKAIRKSRPDSCSSSDRGRTHRSPYLTCTFKDGGKPRVDRASKQKLGDHKDSTGDQKPEVVYYEKYLSRKIMSFQWSETDTTMPEKSDLFKMIFFRIKNKVSPDITVRIKERKFECHSIVLLCYMELSEQVRYSRREIVLDETKVSYDTFLEIYAWMLAEPEKSHLRLSRDNVLQLLEAAKYLGLLELENQCWALVNSEEVFSEATAFFLYLNARNTLSPESREPIMQVMLPRIQRFFLVLVSSKNWIELDLQDVCALLSSNYTRVRCELEIFMSAVRWLQADWSARQQHVITVMQCVRFGLMSPFHLVEIRQSKEFTQMTSLSGVQKLITEGMDVATVKSTHSLVKNNGKELSQMFGLKDPLPRRYLKNGGPMYENHSHIYRDFLRQLNKIKEGEISLNDEEAALGDEIILKHKSMSHVDQAKRRDKSNKTVKEVNLKDIDSQEIKIDKLKQIVKEEGNIKTSKFDKKSATHHVMKLSGRNLQKFNNFNKKSESSHSSKSPQSSVEDKEGKTERAESSVFMEESEAVLVFGGLDQHPTQSRAKKSGREILRYNPFLNTWQLVGKMPMARYHHCTVYCSGLVYLAGGIDASKGDKDAETITNTVWSFNPSSKQWTMEPPMIHARRNFCLVTCRDKIYAMGGQDPYEILSSVECYDPVTRVWREVAPLRGARMALAAAEAGGKIWVAGGYMGDSQISDRVECYDPCINRWSSDIPKLRYPRFMATLIFVNSEKLYLIGGVSAELDRPDKTHSVSDVDVLDITEREWRCVTELVVPRHAHTADVLSSQILIIGGITTVAKKKTLQSVECWCFNRQAWISGVSGLPEQIQGHSSVALPLKP